MLQPILQDTIDNDSGLEAWHRCKSENCGQSAQGVTRKGDVGHVQLAGKQPIGASIQAIQLINDKIQVLQPH
jgi:hypothetical protein